MCMETGRTVILLNMENLYESLYDALNQVIIFFKLEFNSFFENIFLFKLALKYFLISN